MKKFVLYALIFISVLYLFSACSNIPASKTENNSPFFVNHHSDYVSSGSILYFVQPQERYSDKKTYVDAYILSTLDLSTGENMPLCGKPECLHNDTNCNAYIGTNNVWLMLYKGRLYWLEGSYNNTILYSVNIDGTERKAEMQVDPDLYKLAYGMGSAEIADDTLYICGTAENVINGAVVRSTVVFRQPLGTSKGEQIFREDACAEAFGRIMEGKLYFAVSEEFSEEEEPLETRIFSYDIQSGGLEELYSRSEPGTAYRYMIADGGKVYLFGYANGLVYSCEDGGVSALGTEGLTSIDIGDGYCMCWGMGGRYTVRDLEGNELYSGVFPPENDPSFPDALWGRTFIGSSGRKLFYQITYIRQDAPSITQIVEIDTETHSVKALFDSRNNV